MSATVDKLPSLRKIAGPSVKSITYGSATLAKCLNFRDKTMRFPTYPGPRKSDRNAGTLANRASAGIVKNRKSLMANFQWKRKTIHSEKGEKSWLI